LMRWEQWLRRWELGLRRRQLWLILIRHRIGKLRGQSQRLRQLWDAELTRVAKFV
jgi:hypothetical protein